MSRTIDERVVEMRFDNKQFEKGTKETLGTLARLREALKLPDVTGSLENIDKATKNISLKGLESGVDLLTKRFSTLGIVGMRVVENVTDSLMNKMSKAVNFVTDSIVSGGIKRAMNIENAHFQLQALLKDETKVQAIMDDAMKSVDGTAYAYDEAAKAAAQFAASGIEAGESMLGALKGITGVAAMTNSDFESISQIFTTVAGNGRLMGDQLLQLSSRGLNAASTLADYFKEVRGQASMTEGEIREMVTKGKIDFQTFAEAMNWAFGESAERANETFTGALSNMKSALARIGAGFISPLVEQNGELIQLFNALRIKINDVKSALVFDEQRSAIAGVVKNSELMIDTLSTALSKGNIGFEEYTNAILGTSKSEEELKEINEKLSRTFDELKESGYVTRDALKSFSDEGINASTAIRDYFNGVLDGTIKVSDATKKSIEEITGGTKVSIGTIHRLSKEGKISFDTFSAAITNSSGLVGKESKLMSESVKNLFSEIESNGSVSNEMLSKLNDNGIKAGKVLRDYMNGVMDGSIRASYATKQAIEEMSGGTQVTLGSIHRFAEEGKISFDMFTSAMEDAYGEEKTLSKQFTDFFLDNVKNLVTAIQNADMTKPMEVFYYWVEIAKNAAKGLFSVVKPIGSAFKDTFLSINPDGIIAFSAAVEKFTAKLKLSDKGSKNLHDTFKGLFDVAKLLGDGFLKLLGFILPINGPLGEMGDGVLGVTGALGRLLSKFTEFIRSSTKIKTAFGWIGDGFELAFDALKLMLQDFNEMIYSVEDMPIVQNALESVKNKAIELGESGWEGLAAFKDKMEEVGEFASTLDWSDSSKTLENFGAVLKYVFGFAEKNESFMTFISNVQTYLANLKEAMTFDHLLDNLTKMKDVMSDITEWIEKHWGPAFEGFTVGGAMASGGIFGYLYSLISLSKSFNNLTNTIKGFTSLSSGFSSVLTGINKTLTSYQRDLNASALIKIAGAIAILAGALLLLSFADADNLLNAAVALGIVAGTLAFAMAALSKVMDKGNDITKAVNTFSKGLSKSMKNLTAAVKYKAIGSALKDFGLTILMIAGSIVALGIYYRKDPEAFKAATTLVGIISLSLVGMITALSIVGSIFKNGMKNVSMVMAGVLALSIGLGVMIKAVAKLFKMDIPNDWENRLDILKQLLIGLGALVIVIGVSSRIGGSTKGLLGSVLSLSAMLIVMVGSLKALFKMDIPNDWENRLDILKQLLIGLGALVIVIGVSSRIGGSTKGLLGSVLSLSAMLIVMVGSLKALFKMDLPSDWEERFKILKGMFVYLGLLMVAIGGASRLAGGAIKAGGTILAMAAFVAVITGSLFVLSIIPVDKMRNGALALGGVLLTLAAALYGASKVSSKEVYKTVLAMAVNVGVITASLALLSMVPGKALLKSATALGVVLLALAVDFAAVAKANNPKSIVNILGMITSVMAIAYALYALSDVPTNQLLSAAGGLSAVLLAMAASFAIIDAIHPSTKSIAAFVIASASVAGIALALVPLTEQPWQNIIASCVGLGLVLDALSVAMISCGVAGKLGGAAIVGIGILDLLIADLTGVLYVLGALIQNPDVKAFMEDGLTVMTMLGQGIGNFVGGIIEGVAGGISASLGPFGTGLSDFMTNLQPFLSLSSNIPDDLLNKVGILSGSIIAITAAELLAGIMSFLGGGAAGFLTLATTLDAFAIGISPFLNKVSDLKPESMEACKSLAQMIVILTAADLLNGVTNFLGIGGNLADFGEQLEGLGEPLANFAETVKDINPEAVEGAARAAEIMAETSKKLYGSGGLKQEIFGEKSLKDFAEQLKDFGPAIVEFSNTVKDVDASSVEGAARAAEIMATVAEKLPSEPGSLMGWLFGDKSLKSFGEELKAFGPSIVEFSKKVSGLDPSSVSAVESITTIMTTLANGLPDSGVWYEKIFGGGQMTLTDFGEEMVSFGGKMSEFSESLSGVDTEQLSKSVEQFKLLVELAQLTAGTNMDSLGDFTKGLGKIGTSSVKKFAEAFSNSESDVIAAVQLMIKYTVTEIQNNGENFRVCGIDSVVLWISGIESKYQACIFAGNTLALKMISGIKAKNPDFQRAGLESATNYLKGLESGYAKITVSSATLVNSALKGFSAIADNMFSLGENSANGFIDGLNSKMDAAAKASANLGSSTYNALKKSLDIHSPSKKTGELGEFAGIGYIRSLIPFIVKAAVLGEEIGDKTMEGMKSAISASNNIVDFGTRPIISPIMDLTDVRKSADEINRMFNNSIRVTTDSANAVSTMNISKRNRANNQDSENSSSSKEVGTGETNYYFEQNNYSPKALSNIEIYRQTKNAISILKNQK